MRNFFLYIFSRWAIPKTGTQVLSLGIWILKKKCQSKLSGIIIVRNQKAILTCVPAGRLRQDCERKKSYDVSDEPFAVFDEEYPNVDIVLLTSGECHLGFFCSSVFSFESFCSDRKPALP